MEAAAIVMISPTSWRQWWDEQIGWAMVDKNSIEASLDGVQMLPRGNIYPLLVR